jgi:GNAT superfamily N-acetyltransferase
VSEPVSNAIRRLERLDAAFTRYNSERSLLPSEAALELRRAGEAIAIRDRARATTYYYNRIVGLGAADLDHLDDLIAWYDEADIPCGLSTTPDRADEAVLQAIAARGFRVTATNCFFWLDLAAHEQQALPASLHIRRADPADIDTVYDLFIGEEPDPPVSRETRQARAPAHMRPHFPIYLAELEGRPVAMATMFIHEGLAFLGNANTHPDARRRGCQQALIEHRLREAKHLGCDAAASDTSFGTTSHRNIERAGLRLIYQDLSWQRPLAPQ